MSEETKPKMNPAMKCALTICQCNFIEGKIRKKYWTAYSLGYLDAGVISRQEQELIAKKFINVKYDDLPENLDCVNLDELK
jgi:hypothetical protein